jgi:hypothetical protein
MPIWTIAGVRFDADDDAGRWEVTLLFESLTIVWCQPTLAVPPKGGVLAPFRDGLESSRVRVRVDSAGYGEEEVT